MNTTTDMNHNGGSSSWLIFLFGAVYNLLLTMNHDELADFTIRSIIGAAVLLCFKLLGDWISRGGLTALAKSGTNVKESWRARRKLRALLKRKKSHESK